MATNIVQMKDGSGNNQYPVTSAEAVGMPDGSGNLQTYLNKRVTELNISVLYPTNGEGGTNKYTLAGAIAQVPAEYRMIEGLKITFIDNETSEIKTWKYKGNAFIEETSWENNDIIEEHSTVDLAISDEKGLDIVRFENGHIKTKKFDSSQKADVSIGDTYDSDLLFSDEKDNVILKINQGHVVTKKFNSDEFIQAKNGYKKEITEKIEHDQSITTGSSQYKYRGLNKKFSDNVVLLSVDYSRSPSDVKGSSVDILIGEIDQRGWLVNQHSTKGIIDSVVDGISHIVPEQPINIKPTEYIFINIESVANNLSESNVSSSEILEFGSIDDPNNILVNKRTDVSFVFFAINYAYLSDTILWNTLRNTSEMSKNNQKNIQTMNNDIANLKFLTDATTGKKYKLTVDNGVLGIKEVSFQNILVLGNSFTLHAPRTEYGWNCSRGMAASVSNNDWCTLLATACEANLDRFNCVDFERTYNVDYDFDSFGIDKLKSYDLIIVQLNENASVKDDMTESWSALYQYLKKTYPNSLILQIIGWDSSQRTERIQQACEQNSVQLINCNTETYTGNFLAGAYIKGDDNKEYPITDVIITHPSDVGMLLITNRILKAINYTELNYLHNIVINAIGDATITTMNKNGYSKGVCNSIITLKTTGVTSLSIKTDDGSPIVSNNKGNGIYTFVMPNDNIVITNN